MNTVPWRLLRFAIGLAVTTLFTYLVLRHVTPRELVTAAAQVHWIALIVSLAFLVVEYGLRAVRWWLMLRSRVPNIPLRTCVWPIVVSVAVNNVVPLRIGDAFRVIGFRDQLKAPAVHLLGTLIIERLLDMTVLSVFFLAGLANIGDTDAPPLYGKIAVFLCSGVLACWIVVLTAGQWLQKLVASVCGSRLLNALGWNLAAERRVLEFTTALALIRLPRRALQLMVISAFLWTCNGAIFSAVAEGLGYDGAFLGPWFSFAMATLSTLLPSSPGHVGAFDYFAVSGLMAYSARRAMATLFALLVHAVLWLPTTAAGMTYLFTRGAKIRRLVST